MQILPENRLPLDSITLSVAHVLNTFSLVSVLSLLSANHLQGWSRPAENPLPAHTGKTEEEDSEGESLKYTTHTAKFFLWLDFFAEHYAHSHLLRIKIHLFLAERRRREEVITIKLVGVEDISNN